MFFVGAGDGGVRVVPETHSKRMSDAITPFHGELAYPDSLSKHCVYFLLFSELWLSSAVLLL